MKIGQMAKDKLTGFSGRVIGQADYITGCTQFLIQPERCKDDGTKTDACWMDDHRLQELEGEVLVLDKVKGDGACDPAPVK